MATPRTAPLHRWAVFNLMRQLVAHLPAPLIALTDAEVVTQPEFPPHVRAPDVVVVPYGVIATNPPRIYADRVVIAVKVISPGSLETDTLVKPAEYAEAGIPHYWVVDLEPPVSLTAYHLAGDLGYQEGPAATGVFATSAPFALRLDLDALTAPPS